MNTVLRPFAYFLALVWFTGLSGLPVNAQVPNKIKIMLLTGQSGKAHAWQISAPILKRQLEKTGIFSVDMVVSPPVGADMSSFVPRFTSYAAVVLVYEGAEWPEATKRDFVDYIKEGGGLVSFHDTNNAFPYWPEFLEMTGIGGWGLKPDGTLGARDEAWGPFVSWQDGQLVRDHSPGKAGRHPPKHDFVIDVRTPDHPIMRGLPARWLHADDELYISLRGPAKNLTVLATATPDAVKFANFGAKNEPMLMTIEYGKGRVFHTTLGHVGPKDAEPIARLNCVGFITTFTRGTEWAATGEVTLPVPADFPTADKISVRR